MNNKFYKDNNLLEFLAVAKECVTKDIFPRFVHFVICNVSADLDSVVAALLYAFYLQRGSLEKELQYIPVLAIENDELELRTEVVALFRKYEIPLTLPVFENELNFAKLISHHDIQVTLVDHNDVGKHELLKDKVVKIIDHHVDSNDFANVEKNIRMVGSCCSLIAEELYYNKTLHFLCVPLVAEFLLAAILIDTCNLNLHNGRTTELDIFIVGILNTYFKSDLDDLFEEIQKAKLDISSMSSLNLCRKDYKPVPSSNNKVFKCGVSSITLPSNVVLLRKDIVTSFKAFMESCNLNVLIIMFVHFNDFQPVREIAVVSFDENLLEVCCSHLKSKNVVLNLTEKQNSLGNYVKVFDQRNVKSSRKIVLPLIQEMM